MTLQPEGAIVNDHDSEIAVKPQVYKTVHSPQSVGIEFRVSVVYLVCLLELPTVTRALCIISTELLPCAAMEQWTHS